MTGRAYDIEIVNDLGRSFINVDEPYVPNENGPAVLEENEVFDSQHLWNIKEATDHQGNRVYRVSICSNHNSEVHCTMYIAPEQLCEIGKLFTELSV